MKNVYAVSLAYYMTHPEETVVILEYSVLASGPVEAINNVMEPAQETIRERLGKRARGTLTACMAVEVDHSDNLPFGLN